MGIQRLKEAELEVIKRLVVKAVIKQGRERVDVASFLGISICSVNRYIRAYKEKGAASLTSKQRGPCKGYNTLLTEEMENHVKEVIETRVPEQVGLACVLWTRGAVSEYIAKTYHIFYSLPTIGRLLKKWGFTPTKAY